MNKYLLSESEILSLKRIHKQMDDLRSGDKVKAIVYLGSGRSMSEISELLFISEKTIRRYWEQYQNGIKNLLEDEYKGRIPKLTTAQEKELKDYLNTHLFSSAMEIVNYIYKTYGIEYTRSGLVITLHRLGFVYKKTKLVPSKADRRAQEQFVEDYKNIRDNLEPDEHLMFIDAVHPTHNSEPGYAWILKGKEKEIKANTGRQRVNINGAYSPIDNKVIIREDPMINSESTIFLFKQIEKEYLEMKSIFIVCDNARYYYSREVREYLKNSKIVLIFLPPYSPNLNLIERLWKFFKKKVLYNQYYEKFQKFKEAIFDFFENRILEMQSELQSLLTENFHIMGM